MRLMKHLNGVKISVVYFGSADARVTYFCIFIIKAERYHATRFYVM